MYQDSEFPEQINLDVVRSLAAERCDEIAVSLLGDPQQRDRRELRWGTKGSLALDLTKALWYDHERGEGGDIIALAMRELRCSFIEAARWLAQYSGAAMPATRRATSTDEQSRLSYARRLWAEARPLAGSEGERYFAHRGLLLPEPIRLRLRYHYGKRAVVCAFRSMVDHEVTGVQLLPLDAPKKSHGILKGSAVMLLPGTGTLTVSEGVASAIGALNKGLTEGALWALGGTAGLSKLPVLDGFDRLLICGDNDCGGRHAAEMARRSWNAAGRTVDVLLPDGWGKDWADA